MDFYGTLVQWHEGVEAAFREILAYHDKQTADAAPLIHAFHAEGRRLRDSPPYKPDLRLFRHAHAVLGVGPAELIHVAASQPLDMAVCKAMGVRAFWVNRRGEAAETQWLPFTEVKDVAEAARLFLS